MKFYEGKFIQSGSELLPSIEVDRKDVVQELLFDDISFNSKPINELIKQNDELAEEVKNTLLFASIGFTEAIDNLRIIRGIDDRKYRKEKINCNWSGFKKLARCT